ncbi:MAG: hypothetical protein N0E48_24670 [Candidatus Thiodiazotropha endolucinida]|nr:hypothetical protein [Candidatus Thiodiazotropha endolucinida]
MTGQDARGVLLQIADQHSHPFARESDLFRVLAASGRFSRAC